MSHSSFPMVANRYELVERLREGRAFRVHLARDTWTGAQVLVRVLRPVLGREPDIRAGFHRLAENLPPHVPGLLRILAVEQYQDTVAVVEEYPTGRALADVLRSAGGMDPTEALGLAGQLARCLGPLHAAGCAHGLVSPREVFVHGSLDGLQVAGLGLATAFGQRGVPGAEENPYLAPEQRRGRLPTPQSDVYAMAVVLLEALTGLTPSVADLATTRWRQGVPKPLLPILSRALAERPDERYADAQAFANALVGIALERSAPPSTDAGLAVQARRLATATDPVPARTTAPTTLGGRTATCLVGMLYALALPLAVGIPLCLAYARWQRAAPREVTVPDLAESRMDYREARGLLADLGLTLTIVDSEYDPDIPEGQIIWQNPPPGRVVKQGRSVDVRVSRGARAVTVPDVVNMGQEQAAELLKQAGLVLGDVVKGYSRSLPQGVVVSQAPPSGRRVAEGGTVNLLVSQGPNPDENWEDVDSGAKGARPGTVQFTVPQGNDTQRVQVRVTDRRGTRVVYDQLHQPGDSIRQVFTVFGDATVEILDDGQLVDSKAMPLSGESPEDR